MHIELIGCTSAGKTTLTRRIMEAAKRQGVDITLGDDLVLQKLHLEWVKNEFARRRLLEVCSAYVCLRHWPKYREFCRFVFHVVFQAPGSWFYRFGLARIALRKVGIYEIIRRVSMENQLVLVDNEGVVQAAHNIFVHSNGKLESDLPKFVKSAPLPDMVAYLRQPESILVKRTLKRGHPRIPARSQRKVEDFIAEAARTFENLQSLPEIAERLVVIDSESKTVSKLASRNGNLVDRVCDLMRTGIEEAYPERRPDKATSREGSESQCLDIVKRLVESLDTAGISYCHWKSNIKLNESLDGEEDLDLFVGRDSMSRLLPILGQLGFKPARIKYGAETPGVTHYYSLDAITGKLVHLHLFMNLLTGESFVKSHLLPFDNMLLENCDRIGRLAVVSRPAELVLFVLRTFIKYGSLLDMIRLFRNSADVQKELKWLLKGSDLAEALSLFRTHCPSVDESLFLNCLDAIDKNYSFVTRILLARRVKRQLRNYAKYTFVQRAGAYCRVVSAKLRRVLKGNIKNKILQSGGAMIAIVGADATGKSTLVTETGRWLGGPFVVKVIHTGKPSTSWLTAPANLALYLVRGLTSSQGASRLKNQGSASDSYQSRHKYRGVASLLYAFRAVSLAWDRLRLIIKARRGAADGEIIVCDRYPSRIVGAMDSPRLEKEPLKKGLLVTLYNHLVKVENRLYRQVPPPDIVLRLRVSLETAKKRNRERNEQDGDAYLEARHRQSQDWNLPGTKFIYDIDTEQTLEDTKRDVKEAIWQSL